MRLRTYRKNADFAYIASWLKEERIHALWCAGLFSYPLKQSEFEQYFEEHEGDARYVLTEDDGAPVGFCAYAVNEQDNSGFAKFIIIDSSARGKGYGSRMLSLLLKHAFEITNVERVGLRVFRQNHAAINCYRKADFSEIVEIPDTLEFHGEVWAKYTMIASAYGKDGHSDISSH